MGYKMYLTKFKRLAIIQSMLADCNAIKLENNTKKLAGKSKNTWRLSNILNSTWIKEKISKEKI